VSVNLGCWTVSHGFRETLDRETLESKRETYWLSSDETKRVLWHWPGHVKEGVVAKRGGDGKVWTSGEGRIAAVSGANRILG